MVNVAQLVRALDCGSKGRGFEPHLSPIKAVFYKIAFFVFILVKTGRGSVAYESEMIPKTAPLSYQPDLEKITIIWPLLKSTLFKLIQFEL